MRVIGAGLGRTGTLSLKAALERLGAGPCFHMRNLLDHLDRLPLWHAAVDGQPVDWDRVFAGYRSSVDWPGAAFWRELSSCYPDAMVILTVRDPDRWYDSVLETIFQLKGRGPERPLVEEARRSVPGIADVHALNSRVIWDGPLLRGRFADRAFAIRAFLAHNAAVARELPARRLLVYEVSEGWRPLCDFLGVAVPEAPFPHLNGREDFWGRVQARLAALPISPPSRAS